MLKNLPKLGNFLHLFASNWFPVFLKYRRSGFYRVALHHTLQSLRRPLIKPEKGANGEDKHMITKLVKK